MPDDVAKLLSLNIGITLSVLLALVAGVWAIIHEMRGIAQITREVAFMIRRQYGDIDRDLQEIKALLGGQ